MFIFVVIFVGENRWDTAGQERFKCIAASYYRGANVIMIVFDLGSLMSLSHCHQWLAEASRSNAPGNCHTYLIGTKCDLLVLKQFVNLCLPKEKNYEIHFVL